jgi:hypothetical protein
MSAKKMLWPYTDWMVFASVPVFETVSVRNPNQIDFSDFNSLCRQKKDALAVHGPWMVSAFVSVFFPPRTSISFLNTSIFLFFHRPSSN